MKVSARILSVVSVLIVQITILCGQKVDPNHLDTGGYGYLVSNENNVNIWWAEGNYKIMRDAPVPNKMKDKVELWSAKNEYEPFQLIITPQSRLDNIRINISDLSNGKDLIDNDNISLRTVEYVRVSRETDYYGLKGWWPDPLPETSGWISAAGNENKALYIVINTPENIESGIYEGIISISTSSWKTEIPLLFNVWDFTLPDEVSIRSGFGLSVDKIKAYHNLNSYDETLKTFDLYMKAFRDYKISPYYFYALHPIREIITGIDWTGGYFDLEEVYSGKYSYKLVDESLTEIIEASNSKRIRIDHQNEYILSWAIKAEAPEQQYCVMVQAFDLKGELLVFENKTEVFKADTVWKLQNFKPDQFGEDVKEIYLRLFPAFRTSSGEHIGKVWFDDIKLFRVDSNINLLDQGDFEIDIEDVDIELDFSEFDKAAKRYLDEFGFNAFRLNLKGMGSGTYYSRTEGSFAGFHQSSPEYQKLMDRYLSQIEDHLRINNWLGKEYIYWFDEPGHKDYPFVRDGMETIKRSASEITTFLTENDPGPDIMDVTDITCTIWNKIEPEKAKSLVAQGQQYWSYLCTAPRAPWISEFIDHDAVNLRIWLWMSYSYDLSGILIWSTNYWTSYSASPVDYLQNPWKQSMSWVQGYGWPLGKQTSWGNGDGRFFYPPNRDPNNDKRKYIEGPVPSLRLEFLRQGIEDYEYFTILEKEIARITEHNPELAEEANKLLSIPSNIFIDGKNYTKDPQLLLDYRKKLAVMIIRLKSYR